MGRIIETGQTAAKRRHMHMRSCAEVLRLLAERPVFDAEGRDQIAFFVYSLRQVAETIEESARAWDDKNYWKKAEGLREKWRWTKTYAARLEKKILAKQWEAIPATLIELVPKFASHSVTNVTRDADWWCGAYRALLKRAAEA
jgi:hypothetical protein